MFPNPVGPAWGVVTWVSGGLKRNMKTNPQQVPHTSSHRHVKHSCSTVHPLLKSLSYRQQCIYQGSQVHELAVLNGVAVYGKRVWLCC